MKKIILAAAVCLFFSPLSYAQMSLVPATNSDSQSFNKAVEESHEASEAERNEAEDQDFNHAVGAEVSKDAAEKGETERAEHSVKWAGELQEKEDRGEKDGASVGDAAEHDGGVAGDVRGGENDKPDTSHNND